MPMRSFTSVVWSSVGRKILNGLTGILLVVFLLGHLAGNLQLYIGPKPFNMYSHFLLNLGTILYVIEIGIVAVFAIHIVAALYVWFSKLKARPVSYEVVTNAGGASRKNLASVSMIYTGVLLLIFLVTHVASFKYGFMQQVYFVEYDGVVVKDLYSQVREAYSNIWYVGWYVFIMILLGTHLWHGFWSAFQSMGISHPKYSPIINALGIIIALVIAIGFLAIPIWMYITGGVQ